MGGDIEPNLEPLKGNQRSSKPAYLNTPGQGHGNHILDTSQPWRKQEQGSPPNLWEGSVVLLVCLYLKRRFIKRELQSKREKKELRNSDLALEVNSAEGRSPFVLE